MKHFQEPLPELQALHKSKESPLESSRKGLLSWGNTAFEPKSRVRVDWVSAVRWEIYVHRPEKEKILRDIFIPDRKHFINRSLTLVTEDLVSLLLCHIQCSRANSFFRITIRMCVCVQRKAPPWSDVSSKIRSHCQSIMATGQLRGRRGIDRLI